MCTCSVCHSKGALAAAIKIPLNLSTCIYSSLRSPPVLLLLLILIYRMLENEAVKAGEGKLPGMMSALL